MKILIMVFTFIFFTSFANAECSNPCLYNYINKKNGSLILSHDGVEGYNRYVWRGWDRYYIDVKKIKAGAKLK